MLKIITSDYAIKHIQSATGHDVETVMRDYPEYVDGVILQQRNLVRRAAARDSALPSRAGYPTIPPHTEAV